MSIRSKILIIGSEGFIGSFLIRFFMGKEFDVCGCDFVLPSNKDYHFIKHDSSFSFWSDFFEFNKFDFCVNAGGKSDVNVSIRYPSEDFDSNVIEVQKLLEALRMHNPGCKYLHISSAAVYGNPEKLPISETFSLNPISPYGWHKLISEFICKEYYSLYGVNTAIIRPFSVYGPGLKKQIFWDVFNKSFDDNPYVELMGNGNEARDFIFINDLGLAIYMILLHSPMKADVYNVSGGKMTYIKDVVELFLRYLDVDKKVFFNGIIHKGNPFQWQGDISKLKSLGFLPETDIDKGLAVLIDWLKMYKRFH